ncbi:MAG: hypothetical protein WEB00_14805 [Dehalococcoidia bacterium]
MAGRILFIPTAILSPASCEHVPAVHALLAQLRRSYEVEVYHWPSVEGALRDLTVEGVVGDIRSRLTPGVPRCLRLLDR